MADWMDAGSLGVDAIRTISFEHRDDWTSYLHLDSSFSSIVLHPILQAQIQIEISSTNYSWFSNPSLTHSRSPSLAFKFQPICSSLLLHHVCRGLPPHMIRQGIKSIFSTHLCCFEISSLSTSVFPFQPVCFTYARIYVHSSHLLRPALRAPFKSVCCQLNFYIQQSKPSSQASVKAHPHL